MEERRKIRGEALLQIPAASLAPLKVPRRYVSAAHRGAKVTAVAIALLWSMINYMVQLLSDSIGFNLGRHRKGLGLIIGQPLQRSAVVL